MGIVVALNRPATTASQSDSKKQLPPPWRSRSSPMASRWRQPGQKGVRAAVAAVCHRRLVENDRRTPQRRWVPLRGAAVQGERCRLPCASAVTQQACAPAVRRTFRIEAVKIKPRAEDTRQRWRRRIFRFCGRDLRHGARGVARGAVPRAFARQAARSASPSRAGASELAVDRHCLGAIRTLPVPPAAHRTSGRDRRDLARARLLDAGRHRPTVVSRRNRGRAPPRRNTGRRSSRRSSPAHSRCQTRSPDSRTGLVALVHPRADGRDARGQRPRDCSLAGLGRRTGASRLGRPRHARPGGTRGGAHIPVVAGRGIRDVRAGARTVADVVGADVAVAPARRGSRLEATVGRAAVAVREVAVLAVLAALEHAGQALARRDRPGPAIADVSRGEHLAVGRALMNAWLHAGRRPHSHEHRCRGRSCRSGSAPFCVVQGPRPRGSCQSERRCGGTGTRPPRTHICRSRLQRAPAYRTPSMAPTSPAKALLN